MEEKKQNLIAIDTTPKTGNEQLTFNEESIGYSLLEVCAMECY